MQRPQLQCFTLGETTTARDSKINMLHAVVLYNELDSYTVEGIMEALECLQDSALEQLRETEQVKSPESTLWQSDERW